MNNYDQSSMAERPARIFTLQLKIPTLVIAIIALIVCITWSFILGIMIGRGENPKNQLGAIGAIFPDLAHDGIGAESYVNSELDALIPSENLSFREDLRSAPANAASPPVSVVVTPPASTTTTATKPPIKPDQNKQIYDYVFQAASFSQQPQAKRLADQLGEAGIKTRIEESKTQSGTYYRVLLILRGTEADVVKMNETLKQFRLGNPIARPPVPVVP